MNWNEAKNGNEQFPNKQETISQIEELRFAVGARVWRLDCWREADYVKVNPAETTPEDLANLSELHEMLYWFYESVLLVRNEANKPDDADDGLLNDWYARIIDDAHHIANTDVKALIGWTEIENNWNKDKEFRDLWSEVRHFDDILRNTLDAGYLCRRVIRWHLATESERNERHQQMFAIRDLLTELKSREIDE